MIDYLPSADGLALQFAVLNELGGRSENQDALASAHQDNLACFVMSDGAGGHVGGGLAARLVVQAVIDRFLAELSFSQRALQSYLEHAMQRVSQGRRSADVADMTATAAVVLIDQDNRCALWGHLGDTRIYLFRADALLEVTKDHSLVQQFVDAGYVSVDQMRHHPQRSVLFAAIGPDDANPPAITPSAVELRAGDALLICTDGLWEWLSEQDMLRCLRSADNAEQWLTQLVDSATSNSCASTRKRDNYSAQAIWCLPPVHAQVKS